MRQKIWITKVTDHGIDIYFSFSACWNRKCFSIMELNPLLTNAWPRIDIPLSYGTMVTSNEIPETKHDEWWIYFIRKKCEVL